MTYPGHVQNGVVVLDPPAQLPEGATVRVEVVASEQNSLSGNQPLRREAGRFAGQITMASDFDEWPTDIQEALGMTP
jgi:hypothetical protein